VFRQMDVVERTLYYINPDRGATENLTHEPAAAAVTINVASRKNGIRDRGQASFLVDDGPVDLVILVGKLNELFF
jgi:hypothetical protein